MPTSTAKWALPYPVGADPADVPTDMGALAARIEAVGPYAWAQTNGTFVAPGSVYSQQTGTGTGFVYNPSAAGGAAFYSAVQGEANSRFYFDSNGKQWWGPGGSTAVDTNLYRNGAALLQTDSTFKAVGYIAAGVTAGREVGLGWSGIPGGNPGIYFGAAADTNLYRNTASGLKTDGHLTVGNANGYFFFIDTGNYGVGSGIKWGAAGDAHLHRDAVNTLALWNATNSWGTFQAAAFTVQSDRKTKRGIRKAKFAHDKLLAAGIYTYKRDNTDAQHLGLMADELPAEVLDNGTEGDKPVVMVDLYKLSTALVATVQHLNERITALEGA